MPEKSKRDTLNRPIINRLTFFLLWIVLGAGLSVLSHSIFMWLTNGSLKLVNEYTEVWFVIVAIFDSLLVAHIIAPMEQLLLKLGFGQWIHGWITVRIPSIVLSVLPSMLLQAFNLEYPVTNSVQTIPLLLLFLPLAVIFALLETLVVRRYVQKPWLYLLAAILRSLWIPAILPLAIGTAFGAYFTLGASAAVMALMMLWFFRDVPREEKIKRTEAVSHERLQEQAPENEDIPENLEQAQQQKSYYTENRT